MNGEIDKTDQIIELIREANRIAIMPSKVAGIDSFAAGIGMYHILKEEDKGVNVIYPGKPPEEYGLVEGVDIISDPGQRELLVSVDYSGTDASKVNYSTDNDILHFSIGPVGRDFDLSKVRAEIRGLDYDLIITIGAQLPDDLGRAFQDVGGYGKSDVLNIDNTDRNQRFGNINVVNSATDSLSLLVLNLSVKWGLRVTTPAAESLLKGISKRKGI
ncbi:hypothetical protein K0B04_04065 [Patescibacteria group bacterium]|nr:hypothetical protein [Patescibacteria group bacterium]